MKKNIFLLNFILFLLIISCKKDVQISVTGEITDYISGKPIANARGIILELNVYQSGVMGTSNPETLQRKEFFTDINGKYAVNLFSEGAKKKKPLIDIAPSTIQYFLLIEIDNYYKFYEKVNFVNKAKKMPFIYEKSASLVPNTYIKYKYKNVSPFNDYDLLILQDAGEEIRIIGKNNEGYTEPIICGYAEGVDFSNYEIGWSVKKENQVVYVSNVYSYIETKYYSKSINCIIGDTTIVEINY